MKNIFTFLFGAMLLFAVGCEDDDPPRPSIVGTWKPVEMVENIIINDTTTDTNVYTYTDCQQKSRFIFNENETGKRVTYGMLNTSCVKSFDENHNYFYDHKTGEIEIQYISTEDAGYIKDVTANTMSLTLEEIEEDNTDPANPTTTYTSKTYKLQRVEEATP